MFQTDEPALDTKPLISSQERKGIAIERYFTSDSHPYDEIGWDIRDAIIQKPDGEVVFEQKGVEVPSSWSQQATNIVAQKYFRGALGSEEREWSVKQMISRVVNRITDWGYVQGYFEGESASIFHKELTYLLVNQMACFNSPVWFNIGVPDVPQVASACFILDVDDNLESIFNWYKEEGRIFARGSGSGVNISKLRAENEPLSGGGVASGPLSFMLVADKNGAVIKSGGRTRRSAKLVVMDIDHPDIEKFIWCKVKEEQKAQALKDAGFDGSLDGDVYQTIGYQNANNSVSIPDAFMLGAQWSTCRRVDGKAVKVYTRDDLLHQIAEAAWHCGDPGLFFSDTVNKWHTTPSSGRIRSGNPCMEHLRTPNEACNLSSFNLLKFLSTDTKTFDVPGFKKAVDIMVTAMDILVGNADYPTEAIQHKSHMYRTIGLGYNNLGALFLSQGIAYDSERARQHAACITALMTGEAYAQSARLAETMGSFPGYDPDRRHMLSIIDNHHSAFLAADMDEAFLPLQREVNAVWTVARTRGGLYGYRNAQVSLQQPGGTVSLMMDCSTTGVEPEMSLVKYKKLSGGGTLKMISPLIRDALQSLNYAKERVDFIAEAIAEGQAPESLGLFSQHIPVFDCAFPVKPGGRAISWEAHVKMVAAIQPFLSGGVSKSINMPESSTVEDVERAYRMAWELGLKSISIYRDNCKFVQPVTTQPSHSTVEETSTLSVQRTPQRRHLPNERPAITHKFSVGGHEGYLTVGMFDDGSPGELWIVMAKEGSTVSGLADTVATLTSLALQYGVPLEALVKKFSHAHFEPSGFTTNKDIPLAKSVIDYIFRWLNGKFGSGALEPLAVALHQTPTPFAVGVQESESPVCCECGNITVRSGSCYVCTSCGTSSGCS